MARKSESPWERIKRFALWQWGLLCIFGGMAGGAVTMAMRPHSGIRTAEQQGEALGRAAAMLLFVVIGVVLIVVHFVRRKRRP